MPESFCEPLSAMDRQFLEMETANAPMHVSGLSAYELGALRSESGSLDFEVVSKLIEATLERIPRYRQKLAWTPVERRPVWVRLAPSCAVLGLECLPAGRSPSHQAGGLNWARRAPDGARGVQELAVVRLSAELWR